MIVLSRKGNFVLLPPQLFVIEFTKHLNFVLVEPMTDKLSLNQAKTSREIHDERNRKHERWASDRWAFDEKKWVPEQLYLDAQKEISQETADATRILNEAKVEIKTLKNELMLLKSWVYCQCKEPLYNKFGMDNCCARCQKAIENHPLTIQLLKDALKIPRSDEQKLKETQIKEADEKCISYGGTGIDE
jgi:hypothetical protein